MNAWITPIVTVGAAASVAFLVVYWAGARWWTNRIGRSLMGQGFGIALILCYVVVRRYAGMAIELHDGTAVLAVCVYGLIALIELNLAVSFWRELRTRRRARTGRN